MRLHMPIPQYTRGPEKWWERSFLANVWVQLHLIYELKGYIVSGKENVARGERALYFLTQSRLNKVIVIPVRSSRIFALCEGMD